MNPELPASPNSAPRTVLPHAVGRGAKRLKASMTPKVYPVLSIDELRSLDFAPPYDCGYFSWSPLKALKARGSSQSGEGAALETLRTYLTTVDYRRIAADSLLEVSPFALPRPDALITIYRAVTRDTGADYGAILPGAAVSESPSHARWFIDGSTEEEPRLFSTRVFPDELVTHGNPHDFIYVPRSLEMGFDRYLGDVEREQKSELARVRKGLPR